MLKQTSSIEALQCVLSEVQQSALHCPRTSVVHLGGGVSRSTVTCSSETNPGYGSKDYVRVHMHAHVHMYMSSHGMQWAL